MPTRNQRLLQNMRHAPIVKVRQTISILIFHAHQRHKIVQRIEVGEAARVPFVEGATTVHAEDGSVSSDAWVVFDSLAFVAPGWGGLVLLESSFDVGGVDWLPAQDAVDVGEEGGGGQGDVEGAFEVEVGGVVASGAAVVGDGFFDDHLAHFRG